MADTAQPWERWRPWSPQQVAALFAPLHARWWIAGGWAIDLFLGRQTREHQDIDVQVLRRDQGEVRALLDTWDVQAALQPPRDETWPFRTWSRGEALDPTIHDIWCRPAPTQPWALQLMMADSRADVWLCRRTAAITRPLAALGGVSVEGIPYLAPEIQLLFKAKQPRPKDEADFLAALPALDQERRRWLAAALAIVHPQHAWLDRLEQAPTD